MIFSHSSAFAICNHARNVKDDILRRVKENGGVVMVNFYNGYVNCAPNQQPEANLTQVSGIKETNRIARICVKSFSAIPLPLT